MASSNILEHAYNSLLQGNFSSILPLRSNISDAIAQLSRAFEHLLSGLQSPQPPPEETGTLERLNTIFSDFLSTRTTLENTSLFLALTTFVVLAMSWTSRFGNLGRFSPFTRSPPQGPTKVSDADFSYITADDLRRHQAESSNQQQSTQESPVDYGPERDTDILILRNKKQDFPVHFPAYSIVKGELTVGQVREAAAKKTTTGDPKRIKLLYKGKNLKDDVKTCKQEGLRDGAELMITLAEKIESPSDSDDDDEFADDPTAADGEPKRRRNRGKKTKRRNRREERERETSGTSTPQPGEPNLGVPNSQQPSRTQSPKPPVSPATPLDKLNALHQKLQSYLPDCRAFETSPPTEQAKKEFEHKRLTETILTQVLLKLDSVETEGDADARTRRKELVKETQKVLSDLDTVMKS